MTIPCGKTEAREIRNLSKMSSKATMPPASREPSGLRKDKEMAASRHRGKDPSEDQCQPHSLYSVVLLGIGYKVYFVLGAPETSTGASSQEARGNPVCR